MKRNNWILIVVLAAAVLLFCCCAIMFALWVPRRAGGPATGFSFGGGNTVAIVPVEGAILYGGANIPGQTTAAYSDRIVEDLRRAEADPSVAAIVLDVNSPGGSVVASADIHRALLETSKPVVTSMGETAASGGYYIACATERIVARPATMTGSIGVLFQLVNVEDLLDTLGIEFFSITSGPMKDAGSAFDEFTAEEHAMYAGLVRESYDEFVNVVAEGRGLPEERVRELADGRVYSGEQALDLDLIDTLGTLDDAVTIAAELAGISGEPRYLRYERPPTLMQTLLGRAQAPTEGERLIEALLAPDTKAQLLYLYDAP